MKIRKAIIRDIKEIAKIEWQSGYPGNKSYKDCLTRTREFFKEGYESYILENNEKIGYFAMLLDKEKKICYLAYLAVRKKFQGKGFSLLLMKKLFSIAKKNKCKFLELDVRNTNFKAIGLYNRLGFYVTDISKGKDYSKIKMRKELK